MQLFPPLFAVLRCQNLHIVINTERMVLFGNLSASNGGKQYAYHAIKMNANGKTGAKQNVKLTPVQLLIINGELINLSLYRIFR